MLRIRPSAEISIEPARLAPMISRDRTAFALVDVQEDFVGPNGAAAGWGADIDTLQEPLANIDALLSAARNCGIQIVFARVVTRPETDSEALKTFHARSGHSSSSFAICRAGTVGADYHRVRPQAGDIEIEKTLYSSFVDTDLDAQLRARGIDTLLIAGFTTDCCVDSTVRDAFHRNYNVVVVADACGAYEPELHEYTLLALARNFALLTKTAAVIAAWT